MTHTDRFDSCKRCLGARFMRTDDAVELGATRTLGDGQHAADAAEPPVEPKLTARRVLGQPRARNLVRRGEQRERDRQIEAGAFLLQLRRRQVDGDAIVGKLQLCRENPAPDALLRFLARPVGQPDDRQRRRAALNVRLHLDAPRLEADEGKGDRAREHPARLRRQS